MPKSVRQSTPTQQSDDTVTRRALIAFSFIFVSVFLLMQAYRVFEQLMDAAQLIHVLWILTAVFAGLFAACVIWSAFALVRGGKLTLPLNLCLLFALVAASCAVMAMFYLNGVMFLYAALPAAALLYLLYFIYQREFFILAMSTAFAALALWIIHCWRWLHPFRGMLLGIAACVVLLALLGLTLLLRRSGGKLRFRGKRIALLPGGALYQPMILSLAILAACCLIFVFFPHGAFVAMLLLCAYLFLLAVYFTVKMM